MGGIVAKLDKPLRQKACEGSEHLKSSGTDFYHLRCSFYGTVMMPS